MKVRGLLMVAGLAAWCAGLTVPTFAWEPNVVGYTQIRLQYSDSDDGVDWVVRRTRLDWQDTINDEGTRARIQIDIAKLVEGEGDVVPKDIWVKHPWSDRLTTRLGFGDVGFGFDVEYSSSKRLPFERARVTRDFFPDEKDLGLYVTWEGDGVTANLGFTNGMDAWHDDDDDAQALVARVRLPYDSGEAGLSYMTSRREQDGVYDVSPDVWGAHVRYNGPGGFAFQGEYLDGEFLKGGTLYEADGWYGTIEYRPRASNASVFYRYDERDKTAAQTLTAAGEGAVQTYQRHTIGVAWDLMQNNRLTFQIEDIDNNGSQTTDLGLQWQFIYK